MTYKSTAYVDANALKFSCWKCHDRMTFSELDWFPRREDDGTNNLLLTCRPCRVILSLEGERG